MDLLKKERPALVVCDMQLDTLGSLSASGKEALLSSIKIALEAARKHNWSVIYSGLKFESRYEGVSPNHKLYGALKKLNQKLDDDKVHFFMSGWKGSEIVSELAPTANDKIVWRSSHLPIELADLMASEGITKAFVVGAKASVAIQITTQMLMDRGICVSVIKECVQDDDESRLSTTLETLLPVYSTIISLEEVVENLGGLDSFSFESRKAFIRIMGKGQVSNEDDSSNTFYASDCGRRGLGTRYIELLLRRNGWNTYPTQTWYEDFIKGEFKCPLGKTIVDFCDEPEFSKVSIYLLGREYLDEKDKVIDIAGSFMPKTFCILDGEWVGEAPPSDDDAGDAPWFIKVADMNLGGDAIDIVKKPSEIMPFVNKNQRYVVQQHVLDPLLTDDGHKAHVKFYVLLICEDDGVTWNLYTYKASLLSISPNSWSAEDLSQDTQITIHRHHIPPGETSGWKQHWQTIYKKCQEGTIKVIENAIASGKLRGRSRKQFEVFSVDWMPDCHGNIWMFEFNMSPAVWARNKEFDGVRGDGDERRSSLMKHDEIMLEEALSVVMPWDGGDSGDWEHVGNFVGMNKTPAEAK